MENKCCYCGGPAVHYFKTADRWCCDNSIQRCPAIREKKRLKAYERYKNSKLGILKETILNGTAKCVYCGDTAYFIVSTYKPCCKNKAYLCPDHSKTIGLLMKQKYEENPERAINMSETMKVIQNKKDVKKKKSKTMKTLHHGDCIPCVEFQTKYKEGIEKRNLDSYLRNYDFLLNHGIKEEDIPIDMIERASMVNRLKANKSNFR